MFFPFWSTGALVVGVVGYLLWMRTAVVFGSVFTGHVLSVVLLIWFLDFMRELAAAIDGGLARNAPWIVLAALFGGMFLTSGCATGRARNCISRWRSHGQPSRGVYEDDAIFTGPAARRTGRASRG